MRPVKSKELIGQSGDLFPASPSCEWGTATSLSDDGTVGDAFAVIGPDHPDYREWSYCLSDNTEAR